MKKILVFALLFLGINSSAQKLTKQNHARPINSIGINILGDASAFSANYERFFLMKENFILSNKLGFGFNEEFRLCFRESPCNKKSFFTVSHHITGNIGKKISFFEFGIGETILFGNDAPSYMIYPMIGYRILPLNSNKLNFRIFGQVPLINTSLKNFPLMRTKTTGLIFFPIGFYFGVSF